MTKKTLTFLEGAYSKKPILMAVLKVGEFKELYHGNA